MKIEDIKEAIKSFKGGDVVKIVWRSTFDHIEITSEIAVENGNTLLPLPHDNFLILLSKDGEFNPYIQSVELIKEGKPHEPKSRVPNSV